MQFERNDGRVGRAGTGWRCGFAHYSSLKSSLKRETPLPCVKSVSNMRIICAVPTTLVCGVAHYQKEMNRNIGHPLTKHKCAGDQTDTPEE